MQGRLIENEEEADRKKDLGVILKSLKEDKVDVSFLKA